MTSDFPGHEKAVERICAANMRSAADLIDKASELLTPFPDQFSAAWQLVGFANGLRPSADFRDPPFIFVADPDYEISG